MVVLRRKAMILFVVCLVLLFAGIWTFQVQRRQALASMGEMTSVVVASKDLQPWVPLSSSDMKMRQVPQQYVGTEHVRSPDELVGQVLSVPVPVGASIPSYALYTGPDLKPGERTWELRQAANLILDSQLQIGDRVDVIAAVVKDGQESVRQVLAAARVIGVERTEKDLIVILAVTLDQGKTLMEVENFAKQVRVVRDPLARGNGP